MNNNRQSQGGNYQNQPGSQWNTRPTGNQQSGQQPRSKSGAPRQESQPRQNAAPRQNPGQNQYRQNPARSGQTAKQRQNSQTQKRPTPRRQTTNPKVKLTPEQIEINRAYRQREKYRLKKRREAALKVFFARFLLFLLVFAVMCGITAGLFFFNLTKQDSADVSGYTYQIGDEKYTMRYSDAVKSGRLYISFTDVAELCDLALTGSVNDMKFVIKGDEAETVRFVVGTRIAYVNTVETRLSADSYYKNDKLYVPVDFVSAYFKGLSVTVDEKAHKVTVERRLLNELDENGKLVKGEEPIYDTLYFLLASPAPMDGIDEEDAKALVKTPDMNFVNNLSLYEEYMNPGNTKEYLTLINVDHPLDSSYVPQDLIEVENTRNDRAKQQLRLYAAKSLEALFKEMESAGYTDVTVTSGYRGYSYQQTLFNQRLQMYSYLGDGAYAAAAAVVNPPGASEHQSGLCIDMHNIETGADVSFGNTEQFKWLSENCWKFGFILRYPEDKVDKTGISYEPWHYRYVGRYHAQKMYEMGLCLEEYCEYLGIK